RLFVSSSPSSATHLKEPLLHTPRTDLEADALGAPGAAGHIPSPGRVPVYTQVRTRAREPYSQPWARIRLSARARRRQRSLEAIPIGAHGMFIGPSRRQPAASPHPAAPAAGLAARA